MSDTPRRPGVGRWLWYAITGRLDPRYREWAFQDLTCHTWPLRHLARLVIPVLPVAAVLVFLLPGPLAVRLTATITGVVIGLLFSFVFLNESTERRSLKLGYPPGATQAAREERQASDELARETERFLRERSRRPSWIRRWW